MSELIHGPRSKTMFGSAVEKYLEPHNIDPAGVVSIYVMHNSARDYVVTYYDKDNNFCVLTVKTELWVSND
jgi:hypothetical protein